MKLQCVISLKHCSYATSEQAMSSHLSSFPSFGGIIQPSIRVFDCSVFVQHLNISFKSRFLMLLLVFRCNLRFTISLFGNTQFAGKLN